MKKIISIINITLPIILFVILLFNTMSINFVNVMTFSLVIGWLFPFIFPVITGISILTDKHIKLSIIINILTIILITLLLFLVINLYDKNMLLILIFYIILGLLTITNIIYLIISFYKDNENIRIARKKENARIKKLKKENNGIIK